MGRRIFTEGGANKIRRLGPHKYSMSIGVPTDSDGRVAGECPKRSCSPGYFKVKLGAGITGDQEQVFCPYCRRAGEPGEFLSKEQGRYATDTAIQEAQEGIEEALKDALGLGPSGRKKIGGGLFSMEWRYTPGSPPRVRPPVEETLRRDIICPGCGLDHSVFGLAVWCPDCGSDVFMVHVEKEFSAIRDMLGDVDRRRGTLGPRVATRDVENALEDTVSIFEAVLRALTIRFMKEKNKDEAEIEEAFRKRIRNGYQSVGSAADLCGKELRLNLFAGCDRQDVEKLGSAFEKRHPITHNLGVVDRRYLEKARSRELEGHEIRVTTEEVCWAIDLCTGVLRNAHAQLFSQNLPASS